MILGGYPANQNIKKQTMADKLAAAEAKKAEGNAAFAKKDYETAIGFYSEVGIMLTEHSYWVLNVMEHSCKEWSFLLSV
jgi:hypothetical protein